jgi:hypothetical protein
MDDNQVDQAAAAAAQAYDEVMNEGPFPVEAWKEIFSTVPSYPMDLPDDVVRYIADLAIHVRQLAEDLGPALKAGNNLLAWSNPSLIMGSFKRIEDFIVSQMDD